MAKSLILTERQLFEYLTFEAQENVICESISGIASIEELKKKIKRLLLGGIAIGAILSAINKIDSIGEQEKSELMEYVADAKRDMNTVWTLAADDVIATVYNAVKAQCNSNPSVTASMFRLNLDDVASHKIIAMERTFMAELGLKYGDVVKLEGVGPYDGVWQIQDTMNKRFADQHKIDILVPNDVKTGKWENVKLYVLIDKEDTATFRNQMAQQLAKRK